MFGYTAVTDFASVFVAAEEGYFKKRGLDVELKFIPLNSTIPAALQSDSLQIGGPTPSVFLQAVDGGLDLVLVAGGGAHLQDHDRLRPGGARRLGHQDARRTASARRSACRAWAPSCT